MVRIPAHRLRRRPPFFHPVPLRERSDGWTEERQCGFLAQLYVTGSVAAAARSVGLSRMAAYRLRRRADAASFAQAWNHVLTPPGTGRSVRSGQDWRKVTLAMLIRRIESGLVQPVVFFGEMRGIRRKPDYSALLRWVRREAGIAARYRPAGQEDEWPSF